MAHDGIYSASVASGEHGIVSGASEIEPKDEKIGVRFDGGGRRSVFLTTISKEKPEVC